MHLSIGLRCIDHIHETSCYIVNTLTIQAWHLQEDAMPRMPRIDINLVSRLWGSLREDALVFDNSPLLLAYFNLSIIVTNYKHNKEATRTEHGKRIKAHLTKSSTGRGVEVTYCHLKMMMDRTSSSSDGMKSDHFGGISPVGLKL